MKVGYALVSGAQADRTSQLEELQALGVETSVVYTDEGLTSTKQERPGLEKALAAVPTEGELVVTKLDRLARSTREVHTVVERLTSQDATLNVGGAEFSAASLSEVLAMVVEFESTLRRMRTREGMQAAKARGRLRGRKPKLSSAQERRLVKLYRTGEYTTGELAQRFGVARSTVYRAVVRADDPEVQ